MRAADLSVVRLLHVELVEAGTQHVRIPVRRLHRVEETVVAEWIESRDDIVRACPICGGALVIRTCAAAARPVMCMLKVEDCRRVVGLRGRHLFDVCVADTVGSEPVQQVGLDRMDPGHIRENDDRGVFGADGACLVGNCGPVAKEAGGHREAQRVVELVGSAESPDDRNALPREGANLIVFAKGRGPSDDCEHILCDQVLGAGVRGAGVVFGVAPHVLDLAPVDTAAGVDRLHVGADGVALDGGVDRSADVEETADGDVAARNASQSAAARPAGSGAAAGGRRSAGSGGLRA